MQAFQGKLWRVQGARIPAYLLFFLSGAAGLIYELVWTRLLIFSFGSTTFAVSTVLAAFMAGLGFGSLWVGGRADRFSSPIRIYAILEFGIAICGSLIPLLLSQLDPLLIEASQLLARHFVLHSFVRFAITFIILCAPTVLMGATLPVLSCYVTRDFQQRGSQIGWLYALNTFGATAGTLLSGFFLIGSLGLYTTNHLAVVLNLIAAVGAVILSLGKSRSTREAMSEAAAKEPRRQPLLSARLVYVLIFLYGVSGFTALAYEVLWTRALVFFLGNSTYAFANMLTTFLIGIALGSVAGGRFVARSKKPLVRVVQFEGVIALLALVSIPLLWKGLYAGFVQNLIDRPELGWAFYLGSKFLLASLVLLPPAFCFGLIFPYVVHLCSRDLATLGKSVGSIYAANTFGAILGSVGAGFVLIPLWGLQKALIVIAAMNLLVAIVLIHSAPLFSLTFRRGLTLAAAISVIALWMFLPAKLHLQNKKYEAAAEELFYREDHTATVKVYRTASGEKYVSVDGHAIGATDHESDEKQKLLAHLPLLLHPAPRQALTIGLGSGITLGAMAQHQALQQIDCVEIVPSMLAAAAFFSRENRHVLNDPRVRIFVDDGINYVKRTATKYDVIISDAKLNPEYVGNASEYAAEYYRWCNERLTESGIFCQWIPIYLPPEIYRMALRTVAQIFPEVDLYFYPQQHSLVIARKQRISVTAQDLQNLMDSQHLQEELARFGLGDPLLLMSAQIFDTAALREFAGAGEVNNWLEPHIEFATPKALHEIAPNLAEAENLASFLKYYEGANLDMTGVEVAAMQRYRSSYRLALSGLRQAKLTNLLSSGEEQFRAALVSNPADHRAAMLLQLAEAESQQLLQASTAAMASAGRLDYLQQGKVFYQQKDYQRAVAALESAKAQSPQRPEARNLLGLAYQKLGQEQAALAEFQEAVRLDNRNLDYQLNLATALERLNRFEEALAAFQELIKQNPNRADLLNNLGIVYTKSGQSEKAVAAFQKSLALDPHQPEAYNNLGILYGSRKEFGQARQAFETALRNHPLHKDAHRNLALTFMQLQQPQRALPHFQKVVEIDPNDAHACNDYGLVLAQLGRYAEARQAWQRALAIDPNLREARENLQTLAER
jgi:spermidine synthase